MVFEGAGQTRADTQSLLSRQVTVLRRKQAVPSPAFQGGDMIQWYKGKKTYDRFVLAAWPLFNLMRLIAGWTAGVVGRETAADSS